MKKILAIAATLMSTTIMPLPAAAQESGEQPEIFCWNHYPGATYEELLVLCANDVPPNPGTGGGGDPPSSGEWPGNTGCFMPGRIDGTWDCP